MMILGILAYTTSSEEQGGVQMKKKGRRKMNVKYRRSTGQLSNRRFKGRTHRSLEAFNLDLSRKIDIQRVLKDSPVLEVRDGVAINLDYTNPQHLKWLED